MSSLTWAKYNPNPSNKQVGDCAVRAIAKATGQSWEDAYANLAIEGFILNDMPTANNVWGSYLKRLGFTRHIVPDTCPYCYTLNDFCADHPRGVFVVALDSHVVTVENGLFYDTWDSGNETALYYFEKRKEE